LLRPAPIAPLQSPGRAIIRGVRVARIAVLVLALLCCAWFVLGARQAHLVDQATAIVGPGHRLSSQQARHAADLLDAAGTLNPDLQVDVLRGELAIDQGHLAEARQILHDVIVREPKNLAAFQQAARASVDDKPAFYATEIGIQHLVRMFKPNR
jgi:hypothetical protein